MIWAGGCLCGAVRYTVDGPLRNVLVCHCVECRRWAGSAWAATASRREHLSLDERRGLYWAVSPGSDAGARRGSCVECGGRRPAIVGVVDDLAADVPHSGKYPRLGPVARLAQIVDETQPDRVLVALGERREPNPHQGPGGIVHRPRNRGRARGRFLREADRNAGNRVAGAD